jgi:hypothetical protein
VRPTAARVAAASSANPASAARSASATWTADVHPGDYREQQQRWDRLHYARVAVIIAAFVLTLVAARNA